MENRPQQQERMQARWQAPQRPLRAAAGQDGRQEPRPTVPSFGLALDSVGCLHYGFKKAIKQHLAAIRMCFDWL
jgi:hypothetical protein